MKRMVLVIFILALTTHMCPAAIVIPTREPEHLTRVYTAAVDILMTCYRDSNTAVGIVGDSNGSILKILRSNYSIPVVLIGTTMKMENSVTPQNQYSLQAFVITISSLEQFAELLKELTDSIWWNHYANFLIVDSTPDITQQCSEAARSLYAAFEYVGVLNSQFICVEYDDDDDTSEILIINSNPYTSKAPKQWEFIMEFTTDLTPFNVFDRTYRAGGQTCDALNFAKTNDVGGYPFEIETPHHVRALLKSLDNKSSLELNLTRSAKMLLIYLKEQRSFIANIAFALNGTPVLTEEFEKSGFGLVPDLQSSAPVNLRDRAIYSPFRQSLLAITQHTPHMSQLEKIMSVIDAQSRIGMWIVYLITFLFFKFFLRLSVISSLLNLVRLTCNTGLPRLPQNVAPTIYLACLFMFVVTLQAIYTGNLASLLTSTIAYPHVNTKEDIPKLGYKVFTYRPTKNILAADPVLEGQIALADETDNLLCHEYVLRNPLGACILDYTNALVIGSVFNLHVSRDIIKSDYSYHRLTQWNPLGRRLEAIIRTHFECSLRRTDRIFEIIHDDLVDDDEVKRNTVRRVMTLDDLCFAFVILGVGLTCSLVCFIGEIVFHRISLRVAKRRGRVHRRVAWRVTDNKCLSFSALKLRFLRLFSMRR